MKLVKNVCCVKMCSLAGLAECAARVSRMAFSILLLP